MTAQQFADQIADAGLDLTVIEVNQWGGMALLPMDEAPKQPQLRAALAKLTRKAGLRLRTKGIVWTVNGLAVSK